MHTKQPTAFHFEIVGDYKVTLVIYSGLPDPVWTVHSRHEKSKEIKELLDNARAKGNTYRHKNIPAILGFKGFLVHHPGTEHAELILGKETATLQKLLLDTMPEGLIKDTLRQKISQAIDSGAVSPNVPDATQHASARDTSQLPSKGDKVGVDVIQHYAPKYNPDRWNDIDVIRTHNNCYDYANQKITNSFSQPGYASGHPITPPLTTAKTLAAVESDGLLKMDVDPSAPCPEAPSQPNCLMALLVAEGKEQNIASSCNHIPDRSVMIIDVLQLP